MKVLHHIRAVIGGYRRNQSGVTGPIVAILCTALVGLAGYGIDMGHVMWVQQQLQASADEAALAGALTVATDTSAETNSTATAISYSGLSGQKNAVKGASSVTMKNNAPQYQCFVNVAKPVCSSTTSGYNGIIVTQTATVPTYFLKIFGLNSFTPTATATASAKGGQGKTYNVMIVLDTTASMNDAATCTGGNTKIACAQIGAAALLSKLSASPTNKVGFMTYPPLTSSGVTADTTCGGNLTSGQIVQYKNATITGTSSNYLLLGLTASYTATTSKAQILVGNGTSTQQHQSCAGLQAQGGAGTYFADAITAAQAALVSGGTPGAQNVIVLLSDGDAGSEQSPYNTGNYGPTAGQCQEAINAATTVKSANTQIYALAYGANSNDNTAIKGTPSKNNPSAGTYDNTDGPGCTSDKVGVTPCGTMAAIAGANGGPAVDATFFLSDGYKTNNTVVTVTTGTGKNPKTTTTTTSQTLTCTGSGGTSSDPQGMFEHTGDQLSPPRLIPNGTT